MLKKLYYQYFLSFLIISNIFTIDKPQSENVKSIELIESTSDVNQFFDMVNDIEILQSSLNSNENISLKYKEYTKEFLQLAIDQFPNVDYTIFNENLKNFSIYNITTEEMQKENRKNRLSYYSVKETAIYLLDEYESVEQEKYCYFHELWHMFHHLYLVKDNTIFYRDPTLFTTGGTALDEGITTFLTEMIYNKNNLSSYPKQLSEVKILYEIYQDQLLEAYFDSGVFGIEKMLMQDSDYNTSFNLIKNMDEELDGTLENPLIIYETILSLCKEKTNYNKVLDSIEAAGYSKKNKKQILQCLYQSLQPLSIDDNTIVQFDNGITEHIQSLYFIEVNQKCYLVNDTILQDYLLSGEIQNIYDYKTSNIGKHSVYFRTSFEDYLRLQNISYKVEDNTLLIPEEEIRGEVYVKNK